MIDKANELDEYVIQATLISGSRSLIISILCLGIIAWVISIGLVVLAMSLLFVFLVLVSYKIMRPLGAGWHEHVQIVIRHDGLMVIRANGRSNFTDWNTFEAVRLEELAFTTSSAYSKAQFKLTFVNKYKPTISSFIHTKTAENSLFLLPVEFAVQLPQQEATELRELLNNLVESGQLAKTPTELQATDIESLMQLKHCMQCLYSLKGLKRDGICPECGWEFDRSMFLIDGSIISRRKQQMFGQVSFLFALAGVMLTTSIPPTLILVLLLLSIAAITIVIPSIIGKQEAHKLLATDKGMQEWRGTKLNTKHAWENIATLHSVEDEFSRTRIAMWYDKKDHVRLSSFFRYWITRPMGKPVVDIIVRASPEAGRLIISELNRRWTSCSE
ncbi:MAG: hypothetical protein IH984_03320 [Planctomycetes bacterium]|nr:hypothetical protein [Planctomycetota bacterium]